MRVRLAPITFTALAMSILASGLMAAQPTTRSPEKVAAVIVRLTKEVVGKDVEYAKVVLPWGSNEEVSIVQRFSTLDRTSVLFPAVLLHNESVKKLFPNIATKSTEFTALVGVRTSFLRKVRSLLVDSDNLSEQILREYVDGDLLDLRLLAAGRMPSDTYARAIAYRNSKLEVLFMTDKDVLASSLEKYKLTHALSIKTTLISLMELCAASPDVCESL